MEKSISLRSSFNPLASFVFAVVITFFYNALMLYLSCSVYIFNQLSTLAVTSFTRCDPRLDEKSSSTSVYGKGATNSLGVTPTRLLDPWPLKFIPLAVLLNPTDLWRINGQNIFLIMPPTQSGCPGCVNRWSNLAQVPKLSYSVTF